MALVPVMLVGLVPNATSVRLVTMVPSVLPVQVTASTVDTAAKVCLAMAPVYVLVPSRDPRAKTVKTISSARTALPVPIVVTMAHAMMELQATVPVHAPVILQETCVMNVKTAFLVLVVTLVQRAMTVDAILAHSVMAPVCATRDLAVTTVNCALITTMALVVQPVLHAVPPAHVRMERLAMAVASVSLAGLASVTHATRAISVLDVLPVLRVSMVLAMTA